MTRTKKHYTNDEVKRRKLRQKNKRKSEKNIILKFDVWPVIN